MALTVYPKQRELIDCCKPGPRNIVLASGPRKAGKSVGGLIALCERAWFLRYQKICILSLTQSVGTDGGIWDVLIKNVLPQYMEGTEMKWVEEPHNKGTTKIPAFSVSNRFGGVTEFQHRSLKLEAEVEDRFKGPEFTTIFVNELSKFKKIKTFAILHACLRGIGIPEEELLFFGDTNPADEGEDSWIYQLWYVLPNKEPEECEAWELQFRDKLRLVEFSIDDNLGMSQIERDTLFGTLAHDPDLVQRYYYGRWVQSTTDAVFGSVFRPNYHVLGEPATPANPLPDILAPEENCIELCTTWDPGSTTNWAALIGEKWHPPIAKHRGRPSFKFLDELVVIKTQVDYVAFCQEVVKKMRLWELILGRRVIWKHYSDRSVLNMRDLESDKHYAQLIYEASEGIIVLEGVEKGAGFVRAGVDLMKMLFFDDRIWINLIYCPRLIEALKSARPGKTVNEAIEKASKFKHILDAARYWLQKECYRELNTSVMGNMMRKRNGNNSSLVWAPR